MIHMTTRSDVQDLLASGMKQKDIATKLNISEARVSQLKKALKSPLKIKPWFSPTSRIGYINNSTGEAKAEEARLYLHRLHLSYPLLQQAEVEAGRTLQLRYTRQKLFQIDGISCRLTTKHFIVEGLQLYGGLTQPAPELRLKAELMGDGVALKAERDMGLKLNLTQRESKLVEIAITKHQGAKGLMDRVKGKVILYEEPNTHKIVWADRTPNPASIESDSDRLVVPWQKFSKGLEEKAWSITEQLKFNQTLMENQKSQLQWFKHHDQLTVELTRLVKALRSERAQRRLI
jgi:hypothetical protein